VGRVRVVSQQGGRPDLGWRRRGASPGGLVLSGGYQWWGKKVGKPEWWSLAGLEWLEWLGARSSVWGRGGPRTIGGVQHREGARCGRGLSIGFGSWRLGTVSKHSSEKSSGAREQRNRWLSPSSTGAGQRCETMMANEQWRNRAEAVLPSRKRNELCFFPWSRQG
jgi:hypothetical protein